MKSKRGGRRTPVLASILIIAVGSVGCTRYTIETTLKADGSGFRAEEVVLAQDGDSEIDVTPQEYRQLMNVTDAEGWSYERSIEDDDTVHVFRREHRVDDIGAWSDLSGSVRLTGAREAAADTRIGDVTLGDVRFVNSVRVQRDRDAHGRTLTFRETFYWVNALDALTGFMVQEFRLAVERRYPDLPPRKLGELTGLVRGGLWAAIDRGLLDAGGDGEDRITEAFMDRTAEQAALIVGGRREGAERAFFASTLGRLMDDEDDRLEAFVREKLPGVELATNTEIEFRLSVEGRVLDTNAEDREGDVLVWKFGPADVLASPIELYARAAVSQN